MEKIDVEPTGAFVVIDLDHCSRSSGKVRRARKILQSSTKDLARSLTYSFAAFEQQVSGASAGVNAEDDEAADAVTSFVTAISPLVESGKFSPDPGKGVTEEQLAPLRSSEQRSQLLFSPTDRGVFREQLTAHSVATTLAAALGGLDGRTVAIEGFSKSSIPLVREITALGGKVTAIGTSAGTAASANGFLADSLPHGFNEFGAGIVAELGVEPEGAWAIWGSAVDAIVPSTKMGVVSHGVADNIAAPVIVPGTEVPITAKALAHLRRADKAAYPDFVSLAGPVVADAANADSTDAMRSAVTDQISAMVETIKDHEDGPLLAGCYQAESFLSTWRDELPFGRPLAP